MASAGTVGAIHGQKRGAQQRRPSLPGIERLDAGEAASHRTRDDPSSHRRTAGQTVIDAAPSATSTTREAHSVKMHTASGEDIEMQPSTPDHPIAGVPLSDDEKQRTLELFQMMDVSDSGNIEMDELCMVHEEGGNPLQPTLSSLAPPPRCPLSIAPQTNRRCWTSWTRTETAL